MSKNSQELFCANPRCVHLFSSEHDGDNITFTPVEVSLASKVQVVVNGVEESRFRFPVEGRIHLGCRGSTCNDSVRKIAPGHLVCGECMAAKAHVGIAGACRACAHEAADDTARITDADCAGPRLPSIESLNKNLYTDAMEVEQLQEAQFDAMRGRDVDGGTMQRKEELARRRKNADAAKVEAGAARTKAKEAKQRLKAMQLGSMFLEDEEDAEVDLEDETELSANAFYKLVEQDEDLDTVSEMRREFPLHALRWYGPVPTEAQIATQAELVQQLDEESKALKDSYKLVVYEAEQAEQEVKEKRPNVELEEEAGEGEGEEEVAAKKKRKGPKKPDEMTEEEFEAHLEKKELMAAKRKETAEKKKAIISEYPALKAKAEKYGRAKKMVNEQRERLEKLEADAAAAEESAARFEKNQAKFWKLTRAWVKNLDGKPGDWDAETQLKSLSATLKSASE